jgi:hypothetical protein
MENDLEMEIQAIQNVIQSGKRLMIRMRRWKLTTTKKHHKRMIYVCHAVYIMLNIYFTSLVLFEKAATPSSVPTQVQQPSLRLLCTNLPQVVTNDVLSVLFQQYGTSQIFVLPLIIPFRYKGFQKAHVTWSPALNSAGIRVKMAQVLFETPELATTAKEALDGFTLEKGWQMSVVYI